MKLNLTVSNQGVEFFTIGTDTNKADDIIDYLKGLEETLLNKDDIKHKLRSGKVWIYLDNAGIHKTKEVREFIRASKLNVIYGPPYNPQINLAEFIFGLLKRKFYQMKFESL